MIGARARRVWGAGCVLAALAFSGGPAAADVAQPTTPIEHVVTLMQENHSFDNYFGSYPGADGHPEGTCVPVDPAQAGGRCVVPFPANGRPAVDLAPSAELFTRQYADGALDGFVAAFSRPAKGQQALGHYNGGDLPYYWNLADNYVLFDKFFASAAGGTLWNHFYWVAGQPGNPAGEVIDPNGFPDVTTIFDRLQQKGISWKFYVEDYDATITFRTAPGEDQLRQVMTVPLLSIPRFVDVPSLSSHIVPLSEYFTDLQAGHLPAVSYIVPAGSSERAPRDVGAGARLTRSIVTELMRSSSWETSAFALTYDNWGGWFDHVAPPRVDPFGYGFRVPALLVSPYARQGVVDHSTLDFTSILKFIEENWQLEPLGARDAGATSIATALDFGQTPRAPVLVGVERSAGRASTERGNVVYVSYGGAVVGSVGLIIAGTTASRRSRRGSK